MMANNKAQRNDNPIARARAAKGMTQLQLANAIGVMQQQLSAWECGRFNVPVPTLAKIAAVLDVDILCLIGEWQESKKRSPIAAARRAKGFTQAEFAKEVGVSQAQVSNYEAGVYAIPEETLKRMADLLDMSVEALRMEVD